MMQIVQFIIGGLLVISGAITTEITQYDPLPVVEELSVGTGSGVNPLPQFTSTTSPETAITQRSYGKAFYLTGLNVSGSTRCLQITAAGKVQAASAACGSGGGGSGGGTWSTTTSSVTGQLVNYSNEETDIVAIGNSATTSAEFYFDPNAAFAKIGGQLLVTGSSTLRNFTFLNATGSQATTSNFAISSLSSEILKVNASGSVIEAVSGTDYEVPLTFGDGLTRTLNDVDVDTTQNIAKLSNLTGNGFVKTSGGDGTLSVDTTTYESGLTAGDGLTRTANDFDCDTASGSVFGCLASADWTTFNNKQASGNYITALTGDVTASGPGSVAATLATVNADVGSFGSGTAIPNFTVNGKGLVTAAGSSAVVAPAGTLTGNTLAANVVASSLTSVGTLSAGAVPASLVTAGTFGAGAYTFPATLTVTGLETLTAGFIANSSSTVNSNFTITGAATTSSLTISGITGSTQCLQVNTLGQVTGAGSACGSGSGTGNVATSSAETAGFIPYWTSTNGSPATLGKVATTTVSCAGDASCTPFTIIGSSPITITSTGGVGGSWATTSEQYYWSQFRDLSVQGNGYLAPTTTRGVIINASSTIGDGTGAGGLTVNGTATTTSLTIKGITGSTQCLHVDALGQVTGTGSDCGSGGSVNGTIGQVAYLQGTNNAIGTSTISIDTTSFVGIGSTTPNTKLSVALEDIRTTPTGAIMISNDTPATASVQSQYSPSLMFHSAAWRTSNSTNNPFDWRIFSSANQGSTPDAALQIQVQANNGGYNTTAFSLSSGSTLSIGANIYAGATSQIGFAGRSTFQSPSNGIITATNAAASDLTRFNFGNTTSSFPALTRSNANLIVTSADGSLGSSFGVATTSAWARLSVTNTTAGPSFIVEDTTSPDTTPFIIDANGNVGVATTTPATELDVNGLIRVYQTATTTCSASIEGAIFYNGTAGNKHFYGCDGTTWKQLDN